MLKGYWFTKVGIQILVMALMVALGCFLVDPAMAASTGALIQPPGTAGCVSEDGTGGSCADGKALVNPETVTVSPDGRHVYVASYFSHAVAVFSRDIATGTLVQSSDVTACVSEDGTGGTCVDGRALLTPEFVTVSPDGKHVYVITDTGNSVVVFARDRTTGALTQLSGVAGCVSEDGTGGACAIGRGLLGSESAALSPNGKNLYVASRVSGAVAVFSRNAITGELTQLGGTAGCVSADGTGGTCAVGRGGLIGSMTVAVSPDGRHVYLGSLDNDMVAVFSRNATTGALTQLSGTAGCVSEDGTGGTCADGKGLSRVRSVALSRDGRHVYVASELSDAVAIFSRNATTGELTQLSGIAGCVSEDGTGGTCADGKGLNGALSVAVSRDGRHVYVAAEVSNAVAVFSRNATTGELTQLSGVDGCVSEDGTGGTCADGKGIIGNRYVALSSDGKHVYVASAGSNAVAGFSRSATTGVLTQLNGPDCISDNGDGPCVDSNHLSGPVGLSVSRDGKHFYVASSGSAALALFSRNATTGALTQLDAPAGCVADVGDGIECEDGKALDDPKSAAVSPDGKHVYVASSGSNAVAIFSRNATTGELTQLSGIAGCVSEDGTGGTCADGNGLIGASSVAVSPNNRHVYVASNVSNAVAVFSRNATTGALTQLSGIAGCVSEDGTGGTCADGNGLIGASSVAVSPNNRHVYVTSEVSNAVAVFSRNATTGALTQLSGIAGCVSEDGTGGTCADGNGLIGASSVAVSPNNRHVYVASNVSNAVAVFSRNATTGALTQLSGIAGCVSEDGTGGTCADGNGLAGAGSVAVSRDNRHVYVASNVSNAVAVFSRNATTGELTQLNGVDGCVSEDGTGGGCADGKGLDGAFAVVVSPDGKHIYVGSSDINAVTVFERD